MDEEKIIDQTVLAEDLSSKIQYDFTKAFLIKPLEPIMVKKEFDKPVINNAQPKKDENGIEAVDYDKVETEIKEVEADFRKGVVLKVPFEYQQQMADDKWPAAPICIGDVIVYNSKAGKWFDILKDTCIIYQYDIIAVENTKVE